MMLTGPVDVTRVLARAGMTLDDIDLFEVNEALPPSCCGSLKPSIST